MTEAETPTETEAEPALSNIKIKFADPTGRPIAELKYQVRQAEKIVADGSTDANGESIQFQSPIGSPISVSVQRFASQDMKVIREFTPWCEIFPIVLVSGKVLQTAETVEVEGAPGRYRRKTYLVQSGDTVESIAQGEGCGPGEMRSLNRLSADEEVSPGQVLKVPASETSAAAPGAAEQDKPGNPPAASAASADSQPPPASATPPSEAPPAENSRQPMPDKASPSLREPRSADHSVPPPKPKDSSANPPAPPKKNVPAATQVGAPPTPAPKPTPKKADAPPAPPPEPAKASASLAASIPKTVSIVMSKLTSAWTSILEDVRGASGSPKTVSALKCPGVCLKVGDKGLLVEELNIRLTGFGGTVCNPHPLDEFTVKTEAAVKQFQRDFMKAPETGKVCGSLLLALDQFSSRYPIDFSKLKCKCGSCSGFGNGYSESSAVGVFADAERRKSHAGFENPGIHRAIFWALRAALFYADDTDKDLDFKFLGITSGYRCWHANKKAGRNTTNHMGNAIDLQFSKGSGNPRCVGAALGGLRNEIFIKRLKAQNGWQSNNILSLEPIEAGARSWVHMDVRNFSLQYKNIKYYAITQASMDGDRMEVIVKRSAQVALVSCKGLPQDDLNIGPSKRPDVQENGFDGKNIPAQGSDVRMKISALKPSKKIIDFIKAFEECKLKPYDDANGFCTIGWGSLIARKSCTELANTSKYSIYASGIGLDHAESMFIEDIKEAVEEITKKVQVSMHQYEYDALVSLVFSLGNLRKCPKLLSKLNTLDYEGCCNEFLDITNNGLAGLVVRRKAEANIFGKNFYDSRH